MQLRQVCDDFIQIGDIAILNKKTGNDVYAFDFRNNFECKSAVSELDITGTYGGTWNTPDYTGKINDNMPETALLGNGDVGVVSYGNEAEKTYLFSKGDFWNGGNLVTSAPYSTDDRSIRQIALGGVTMKQDRINRSLTRKAGVTVTASSVHDDFVPQVAVNGIISEQEEV